MDILIQVPGRNPVAVIGHSLWQRRFNSDPELVGKTININNQPLTVRESIRWWRSGVNKAHRLYR